MTVTYTNPVYNHDFPDPFVLKYCGEYWAYCTGFQRDGRIFGILHSHDLVNWQEVGSALDPLPGNHTCYWAPEVSYDNGRFFLYYSVGDETMMHIRVATAIHPAGPFVDSGRQLTSEPFAIDPHVFVDHAFVDDDGRRYLFYATDFLEHTHIGTGTAVDRLLDPLTTAGRPQPVTRACYDWHVYDPQRVEKGGVRWHTLEGPFVLKHKGRYYQMFSGGNWQNDSYGVGYATTDTLETAGEWAQMCDGEATRPILRTIPGQVIGPGHNSAVRGPDNRQLYCVYHRWGKRKGQAGDGRLLAIDPLDWAGERMRVLGPTSQPQPAPLLPTFDGERVDNPLYISVGVPFFVAEVSIRATSHSADGRYGIRLEDNDQLLLEACLQPGHNRLLLSWKEASGDQEQRFMLPSGFDFQAYHLLRLEVDSRRLSVALDETVMRWQGVTAVAPTQITLWAEQTQAAFAGFAVTVGWEDLFMDDSTPAALGWISDLLEAWQIKDQQLIFADDSDEGMAWKGPFLESYELVVNACLADPDGVIGFFPAMTADNPGLLLTIERDENRWVLRQQDEGPTQEFPLPAHFDPIAYQQFRFRKENGQLTLAWEGHLLGQISVTTEPTRIGLYGRHTAAFDLVRVTAIPAATATHY